jgi:hypothetical protein
MHTVVHCPVVLVSKLGVKFGWQAPVDSLNRDKSLLHSRKEFWVEGERDFEVIAILVDAVKHLQIVFKEFNVEVSKLLDFF